MKAYTLLQNIIMLAHWALDKMADDLQKSSNAKMKLFKLNFSYFYSNLAVGCS